MTDQGSDLAVRKARLRTELLVRRDALAAQARDAASAAASARMAEIVAADPRAAVSAYWPMGEELDVRPLLTALHAAGHVCALPEVTPLGTPLVFRRWRPGDELRPGPFGTRQPLADAPAVVPDWLVVPLLAFDSRGFRLGYGGGYYDRTIAKLRRAGPVVAAGIAFDVQEVDTVPIEPHDQRLDWIVTETRAIRIGDGG